MEFLEVFLQPGAWVALLTLMLMEVILGIDNVVFLSIMASRLPARQQPAARAVGLILAMLVRIALLFGISLLMTLTKPIVSFETSWLDGAVSGQSLIIFAGGLFLLYKSVSEVHHKLEGVNETQAAKKSKSGFWAVVAQIVVLDMVFSLDSVLTAVGMVSFREFGHAGGMALMIIAVIVAVMIMLWFSGPVSRFVSSHPTIQMLALSFLILISVMLLAEAAHLSKLTVFGTEVGEIPKGYIYFAIAFSLGVEVLNMKLSKRSRAKALRLRDSKMVNGSD